MQLKMLVGRFKRGRETRHLPPHFLIAIVIVFFFGPCGWGPISRVLPSVVTHRFGLTPPHPLPAECRKGRPRKGVGDNLGRQPYCRTLLGTCVCFSPFSKGKMLSVFFIFCFSCLAWCLLPFSAVLLFLGSLFEKIFGSELLFLGVGVGLVFFGGFLLMNVALFFGGSLPEVFGKILLMSGLLFFGFVLSSFVFSSSSFFLFKRQRSGSNRTPPHAPFCFFLFLFVSRRACCFALFGRASFFLAFSRGAILGPARFSDSLGTLLLRPFLLDARRQGCFLSFLLCRFCFPFCVVCGYTHSFDARVGDLTEVG